MYFSIPESKILGASAKTAEITALFSLIIVLLGIPMILFFSRLISSPINKITQEASRIKALDLGEGIKVKSMIKEIKNLSREMTSMKNGLRCFNKYVPSRLVKLLMETGTGGEIGGRKKDMSFFFSDIQSFTGISEKSDPELLFQRLSEYFEIISGIIRGCNGTVDKFMGDAVMAFWNAPHEDPLHTVHACEAAIMVQKKITALNTKWQTNGLDPFQTRIGLSCGEAVVGNVGSEDRMNYTVIGDPVNASSRLEGINKIYKTSIIACESTVLNLDSSFLFRPLDKIIVKGQSVPVTIYELIGFSGEQPQEVKDFAAYFAEGFSYYFRKEWHKAETLLAKARMLNPDDYALQYLFSQITSLREAPPDLEWTGIRKMAEKL